MNPPSSMKSEPAKASGLPSILITGAHGMLGTDVALECRRRGIHAYPLAHADCDITSLENCRSAIAASRPTAVINCAGYTKVDMAEAEEGLATAINGTGPANLAVACAEAGVHLIHVSTDYVFDGTRKGFYLPDDPPNPINAYGRSKLAGELAVTRIMPPGTFTIARTSWLFGSHGPNFVTTMLRLAREGKPLRIVDDQVGMPTYTVDLARALVIIAGISPVGIIHLSSTGYCSWFTFAKEIFRRSRVRPTALASCTSEEYPTPARRPANTRLCNEKLAEICINPLPTWQDALHRFLREIGEVT